MAGVRSADAGAESLEEVYNNAGSVASSAVGGHYMP